MNGLYYHNIGYIMFVHTLYYYMLLPMHRNILLEKNALWQVPDQEYTPSLSTLSAVWPDLRHGKYNWKVVSDQAIRRFAFVQPETAPDYGDYDCMGPQVLACGETQVGDVYLFKAVVVFELRGSYVMNTYIP